jgi:hypothetical protein
MEVRDDGRIQRDRLLAEMVACRDVETGQSMWRAMGRYHWKRMERPLGEFEGPLRARCDEWARARDLVK